MGVDLEQLAVAVPLTQLDTQLLCESLAETRLAWRVVVEGGEGVVESGEW